MEDTKHIKISEYDYPLPDERIAKFPLQIRDQSKLLVYNKGNISDTHFTSLPDYLEKGELMIFNNTQVLSLKYSALSRLVLPIMLYHSNREENAHGYV